MRAIIILFLLLFGGLLAAACAEDKKPPVIGPAESDGDADMDSDADGDGDADPRPKPDPDAPFVGIACTAATAATDCGGSGNLFCVDGVCCRDQCTAECGSCAVPGHEGVCTALEAGTVCRPAAMACDEEETCDGTYKTCPPDELKPLGASCGDDVDNDCDNPDTCDIDHVCQPNYAPAGGACTDPSGYCKVNPLCDGAGLCTSAVNKADGEACGSAELTECDTPDSCLAGVCEPNYIPAGTACGDVTTVTECNLADSCDGVGLCASNLLEAGTPCGDATENECNQADQCDTAGVCDSRLIPDATACGDDATSECDKPDSCLAGVCAANLIADGTVCNDGESTVVYRCSDTDCSATPQRQVVGWTCATGLCAEVITPEWESVGEACTTTEVCTTDASTYAQCMACDDPGLNECIGTVATGYKPDGVCSSTSGVAECVYEPMSENCLLRTDGAINCVDGACSAYTCEPGENDNEYSWDAGDDGWTIGAGWSAKNSYPWTSGDWQNKYWEYSHGSVESIEDTYLLSPAYELYACDQGSVTFYFTAAYQTLCSGDPAEIQLACGYGEDWTVVWSEPQGASYSNPNQSDQSEDLVTVDIANCLDMPDIQFRFSVANSCSGVQNYWVDHFTMTAVQTVIPDTDTVPMVDTTPVDTTPVDTTPVDTTPVDTTPVDTTPVDTTPVDTTPVDTTPVDTDTSRDTASGTTTS